MLDLHFLAILGHGLDFCTNICHFKLVCNYYIIHSILNVKGANKNQNMILFLKTNPSFYVVKLNAFFNGHVFNTVQNHIEGVFK